ncbi:MAG TPA: arylsulfotransferase family protein [Solirubrobacteraceae bacterium]
MSVPLIALAMCSAISACGSTSTADPTAGSATSGGVAVSPMPGTPDASPTTQISFLGGAGTQVSNVHVVGSHSGVHTGVLRAYSTGTGESFLPAHPFAAGEKVTVHAQVAGTNVSTTFTVAHQASVSQKPFPKNPGDRKAVQHYSSAPTLTPSTLTITTPAKPGAAPGDFFLAPYQGMGSPGPMIVDQHGQLVWFHPLPGGDTATNFQVQSYEGKPVLTWWQGKILGVGFGQGEDLIYNSSYRRVAEVKAGNGYHADLHEIRLTGQGTAWIDCFDPIHMNLSSVKGSSNGVLTDSVIQEIDIKTGLVMWEWHALGHIALSDSLNPVSHGSYPWDYVHINSISPGGEGGSSQSGDVLLSARNTWTLYDVNMRTGAFNWLLGDGRHSTFKLGPGVKFYWQHDAEFQPEGLISVFDNGSDPPKEKQSRGLLLDPNTASHKVTLVKQFSNPTKTLLAESQGNMLSLPGGNWLLGYGRLPNFTEFDSSGHVLFSATLGKNVQDFRTYLAPWTGQPSAAPQIAVQGSAPALTVQASWNGATNVAAWQVLAGSSQASLAPVTAIVPTQGFQSTIHLATSGPLLVARALDSSGAVLGSSEAVSVR